MEREPNLLLLSSGPEAMPFIDVDRASIWLSPADQVPPLSASLSRDRSISAERGHGDGRERIGVG